MRHAIAAAVAGLCLAGVGHAAQAQVLASADSPALSTFASSVNRLWPLDGTNTTLSFRTSKNNEQVQFSFSAFCGSKQAAADGSGGALSNGFAQVFFFIDSTLISPSGNANLLCAWTAQPATVGFIAGAGTVTEQRVSVATPGVHTLSVLMQIQPSQNGSKIATLLGQTHASVSK